MSKLNKTFENVVQSAFVQHHLFSEKQHKDRKERHPEVYKPGFWYNNFVSAEDKEILKNLKLENNHNYDRLFIKCLD